MKEDEGLGSGFADGGLGGMGERWGRVDGVERRGKEGGGGECGEVNVRCLGYIWWIDAGR